MDESEESKEERKERGVGEKRSADGVSASAGVSEGVFGQERSVVVPAHAVPAQTESGESEVCIAVPVSFPLSPPLAPPPPLLLVGPAGAGKSTLADMLEEQSKYWQLAAYPPHISHGDTFRAYLYGRGGTAVAPRLHSSVLEQAIAKAAELPSFSAVVDAFPHLSSAQKSSIPRYLSSNFRGMKRAIVMEQLQWRLMTGNTFIVVDFPFTPADVQFFDSHLPVDVKARLVVLHCRIEKEESRKRVMNRKIDFNSGEHSSGGRARVDDGGRGWEKRWQKWEEEKEELLFKLKEMVGQERYIEIDAAEAPDRVMGQAVSAIASFSPASLP
eukprot:CAMPEP_0113882168 /NCGR_PEP_ID=MMETSP0780_2-20120614/8790_1 /TAXON_ID=652834 /ORGANISM="Palpitomonas bilix" /LENGTH=327 /DNA_ID=CAMNT_0000869123 /DNA_START=259 /DNA_END=1242 /DNA_ORIENTATION=+ /assembly_acc=CAM_ASM_000599